MGKVAYRIKDAAASASVDKAEIVLAIQNGTLVARRIGGHLIVARCDLKEWVAKQPDYLRTMG